MVLASKASAVPWSYTSRSASVLLRMASGSAIRSRLNTMSSAVTGWPSCQVASWIVKVYSEPSALTAQPDARSPMIPVGLTGLYSTRPLNLLDEGMLQL